MSYSEYDKNRIKQLAPSVSREHWMPIMSGWLEERVRVFMSSHGFYNVNVPLLNDSYAHKRSVLTFEHNGRYIELTKSSAMHISALSAIYGPVYTLHRVIRDEACYDANHLSEFHILEAEWPCSDSDYEELLHFLEELLSFCMSAFNEFIEQHQITELFTSHNTNIFPLARVDYSDVPDSAKADPEGMYDLGIGSRTAPYFIMFYPPAASWRAKVISRNRAYIFNLVLPGEFGELAECSLRETSAAIMHNKFTHAGLCSALSWYLDAMNLNQNTRCGFGLGFERLCRWLMSADDISLIPAFSRRLSL